MWRSVGSVADDSYRFTDEDGTVWERTGSCPPERCRGRCCTFMTFGPFLAEPEGIKWAKLHPGVAVSRHGPYINLNLSVRCSALSDDGLCTLYGTPDRPQTCHDWPTRPSDLLETPFCGYAFRKIEAPVAI